MGVGVSENGVTSPHKKYGWTFNVGYTVMI